MRFLGPKTPYFGNSLADILNELLFTSCFVHMVSFFLFFVDNLHYYYHYDYCSLLVIIITWLEIGGNLDQSTYSFRFQCGTAGDPLGNIVDSSDTMR